VENEALDVGCTHLVKPTLFAGRHSGASQHAANEALVIRLPVVPSVPIHDLLGDEWTHFCASPYHTCRSGGHLRLAMDSYFA
jgi:hypothetical protein